jgi:hypothetical protein
MPAGDLQAEFLFHLADRARVVVFAGAKMTGGARVVMAGKGVLGGRPLLDEEPTPKVEEENVDCAVTQSSRMDFYTRRSTDDPVRSVNDIEPFIRRLFQMRSEL